jgi:hypothetical protein
MYYKCCDTFGLVMIECGEFVEAPEPGVNLATLKYDILYIYIQVMIECGEFVEAPEPGVNLATLHSNAVCVTLFCLDALYDCLVLYIYIYIYIYVSIYICNTYALYMI